MSLASRIASHICKHPRLANVPVPVVDAAVDLALDTLAEILWPECTVEKIAADDLDWCTGCDEIVIANDPEAVRGGGEDGTVNLHGWCLPDAPGAA